MRLRDQKGMIITKRSKYSLCQFLDLFAQDVVQILLEKHGITTWGYSQTEIGDVLSETEQHSIAALIVEVVNTSGDLRNRVSPRYRFDERWSDFEKCLLLDGYKIKEKTVLRIEPVIDGVEPLEDDLIEELEASGLELTDEINKNIKLSAESFKKSTPDYNACLSHARIALETIVRTIATTHGLENNQGSKAWGKSLSHIRGKGVLTTKDENTISSTYTFISDGAHIPVGFSEEEFVRFGRNLAMAMCYFIVKKFNGL